MLQQNISLDEIEVVLKQTEDYKSPGLDGLTYEFYKTFLPILGDSLVELYNNSLFTSQQLPDSFNSAVISLQQKSGDLKLIQNWRPISPVAEFNSCA